MHVCHTQVNALACLKIDVLTRICVDGAYARDRTD